MPQVPRYDAPQVSPTGGGLNVSVSEAAFGSEIGAGLRRVGAEVDKFGDVLAKNALLMQARQNEAEAKEAFFNATVESGELETWYRSLQGKSAVQAYPEYTEKLRGVRDKYTNQMSNPESRRMFDSDFTRRLGLSIVDGARYSAAQEKRYVADTDTATLDIAGRDVNLNPESEGVFRTNLAIAGKVLKSRSEMFGWSPERIETEQAEVVSNLTSSRIEGLSRKNLPAARELFEKNRSLLTPEAQESVQNKFLKVSTDRQSAVEVERFNVHKRANADVDSMLSDGVGDPTLNYKTVENAVGTTAAEDWQYRRSVAEVTWRNSHDLVTLPDGDIDSRLIALQPKPGETYARDTAVYMAVKRRADFVRTMRNDDPAESVAVDPEVQKAIQNMSKDPASVKALLDARMSAQLRAGIEYPSPISKQEALAVTVPLKRMLPGEERDTLVELGKEFQKSYGEYADEAFVYALRAHKINQGTARVAANVMKQLGLGRMPTEPGQMDTADEIGAADAAAGEQSVKTPPKTAIEALIKNPGLSKMFDKKYGAGQSKKILEFGKK